VLQSFLRDKVHKCFHAPDGTCGNGRDDQNCASQHAAADQGAKAASPEVDASSAEAETEPRGGDSSNANTSTSKARSASLISLLKESESLAYS